MKRLFIPLYLLLSLLTASCESFLDVNPKGTVEEKGDRSAFGKEQGAQENRAGTGSATGHRDAGTQACNLVETGRSV